MMTTNQDEFKSALKGLLLSKHGLSVWGGGAKVGNGHNSTSKYDESGL